MNRGRHLNVIWKRGRIRLFLFPASLLLIYGILFAIMPDRAFSALRSSGRVFLHILVPLCLVFILMLVLNLFLKPAYLTKLLGRGAGIKGIIISAAAGIISIGPIYAWYPMLKALRERGVDNSLLAIFLGNRAVKPFLLPIMISYFGWIYVFILTLFTILGALVAGYCVEVLVKEKPANPII